MRRLRTWLARMLYRLADRIDPADRSVWMSPGVMDALDEVREFSSAEWRKRQS